MLSRTSIGSGKNRKDALRDFLADVFQARRRTATADDADRTDHGATARKTSA